MSRFRLCARRSAAAVLCLALASCAKSKEPADFAGVWPGYLVQPGSPLAPAALVLEQSGENVTGTVGGAALLGTVDGDTLTFSLDFEGWCGTKAAGSARLERHADRDRAFLSYSGASTCSGSISATGAFDRMRCPAPTSACDADYVVVRASYCADLARDGSNCGGCTNRCHDLQVCVDGFCEVPACRGPVPLEAPRSSGADGGLGGAVVLADVDGDGALDAVGSGCTPPTVAGEACHASVRVLRGDGGGGLSASVESDLVALFPSDPVPPMPPSFPTPLQPNLPSAIAVGDLDGDGRPDLAAYLAALPYPWTLTSEGEILTLLGNGDGSFRAGERFRTGAEYEAMDVGTRTIAVADLDGDGVPDLAARSGLVPAVQVRLGNGDGTLGPEVEYGLPDPADALAVADLDGDGIVDLAVASDGWRTGAPNYRAVSALLGNGDGTFRARIESPGVGYPGDLAVADLDEDGIPDLLVTGSWDWAPHDVPDVSVLLGNGDGSFRAPLGVATDTWSWIGSAAVADLDADGHLDLAAGDYGRGVELFLGRGDGTFSRFDQPIRGGAGLVAAADLDRDGRIDLVATGNRDDVVVLRACAR